MRLCFRLFGDSKHGSGKIQPDDLTVPEEYRGIGVRIEDDIVVTDSGCVNLSAAIPRTAADVEQWVQAARSEI